MNARILAATLLLSAGAAHAQDDANPAVAPVGSETRVWVDLQTGGTAASTADRSMPGDIAARVYQRHADSFAKPIPDSLGREAFVGDAGGSE